MVNSLLGSVDQPNFLTFTGLCEYLSTVERMRAHAAAIRAEGATEAVWLLEHASVYTAGTSARHADLLTPSDVPVYQTGRGGQWTYHGPGQRVAYVMLDLQKRGRDVRCYVNKLESWIIEVLGGFGVIGQRRAGLPGIWVKTGKSTSGLDKIAAIGIRISRWVSWHGIAINNDPDLDAFHAIVPCGVQDAGVTSLAKLGISVSMDELDTMLKTSFEKYFNHLETSKSTR